MIKILIAKYTLWLRRFFQKISLVFVCGLLIFLDMKANSGEMENNLINAIVEIGKNGELRDLDFIQEKLKVNFPSKLSSFVLNIFEEKQIISAISLSPDREIVPGGEFHYRITTNVHRVSAGKNDKIDIATMQFIKGNGSFCVSNKILKSMGLTTKAVLLGSNPPLSSIYVYSLYESPHFETVMFVSESVDDGFGRECSKIVTIQQLAL